MGRKDAAVLFLQLVATGRVQEGYARFIAAEFRHHNPYFKGDAQTLMVAMDQNARQYPSKRLEVYHVLEDGDFVAVHAHVRPRPEDLGFALVHLFRFQGDRIAELWDVSQPVPADSPNDNGMFLGVEEGL
jgi:predicted SnoaL-like aldol condensation-catalyzing enzyme